jgi:hypothetical protein
MLYVEIPYLTVGSGLVGSAIDTLVCAYLPYRQTMGKSPKKIVVVQIN